MKYYHPNLKWYTRLSPWFWINNLDDPVPPARFDGHYREFWVYRFFRLFLPFKAARWVWWRIRNPLHNCLYYTVGFAGRDIIVYSRYAQRLFAPKGGFNWFIVNWKILYLPGLTYRGKRCRWYIGWLDDGQLGFELREVP